MEIVMSFLGALLFVHHQVFVVILPDTSLYYCSSLHFLLHRHFFVMGTHAYALPGGE